MVIINNKNGRFFLEFKYDSWYTIHNEVTEDEAIYLNMVQSIFQVNRLEKEWVQYDMVQHQVEWHLNDVALRREQAPTRIVIKSRNTSFTVNTIISNLIGINDYRNPVFPISILNREKSYEFIDKAKELIKHMKPIIVDNDDGTKTYIPFNPRQVNMDAKGSIKFPNGTEWKAYPSNSPSSAESIRSIRTRGPTGIVDEWNFMRYLLSIYGALKYTSSGSEGETVEQQIDMGTTLKGNTVGYDWFVDIKKKVDAGLLPSIKIYEWQIFDPAKFEPYLSKEGCDIPFYENDELTSIVPWHSKRKLWEDWIEGKEKFLEECMAVKVDSEGQFYKTKMLLEQATRDTVKDYRDIDFGSYHKIRIGIDPAAGEGGDFFSTTVLGWYGNKCDELFIENDNKTILEDKEREVDDMLTYINSKNENWLCTNDATPIGKQLTQSLQRAHGFRVRGVTGNKVVKTMDGNKYKLNEYLHTIMRRMLSLRLLALILDDVHIKHFQAIGNDFKALRGSDGHADSAMSTGYALLPDDLDYAQDISLNYEKKGREEKVPDKSLSEQSILDRIKHYKTANKSKLRRNRGKARAF